jgi:molybdopterin biosynthesis enzyme
VGDGVERIAAAIAEARQTKPDILFCTGGMSVDPDDNTPGAIRQSGAEVVTYGVPVLPGSMFLLGYFADGVPVCGLPGGAVFKRKKGGILDLVLPRLAARVRMTKKDFVLMGEGGYCLGCADCHYPVCPYGK